jgi:hypothetical protein
MEAEVYSDEDFGTGANSCNMRNQASNLIRTVEEILRRQILPFLGGYYVICEPYSLKKHGNAFVRI